MKKVILISIVVISAGLTTYLLSNGFKSKTTIEAEKSFSGFMKSYKKLQKALLEDSVDIDLKFISLQKMYNPSTNVFGDSVYGELPQVYRDQFFAHQKSVTTEANTYYLDAIELPVSGKQLDPNIFVIFGDENKSNTDTLYYYNELRKDAEHNQGARTCSAIGGITPTGEIFTYPNSLPKEVVEREIIDFLNNFTFTIKNNDIQ